MVFAPQCGLVYAFQNGSKFRTRKIKHNGIWIMKPETSKRKENYIQDMFEKIESEIPYIDIKPYSKNLIEIRLRAVANRYGITAANKLIDDLGLESYGWKKEKVKKENTKKKMVKK